MFKDDNEIRTQDMCPKLKMYLFKLQNVFFKNKECICQPTLPIRMFNDDNEIRPQHKYP